jgi:hypothetical protein
MNVLAGTAASLPTGGSSMIVELQCDANDVVAGFLEQSSGNRGVDAAGHGDNHAARRVYGPLVAACVSVGAAVRHLELEVFARGPLHRGALRLWSGLDLCVQKSNIWARSRPKQADKARFPGCDVQVRDAWLGGRPAL